MGSLQERNYAITQKVQVKKSEVASYTTKAK